MDLGQEVDSIHTWLTAAAEDPTAYAGLKKKDTVELLFKLARRGINLRRSVVDSKDLKGLGDPARTPRIQVIAAKADAYFPIEFFYDFPTPTKPVLCPNAADALRDGHCDPAHHGPVAADGTIGVVCPVGFWAMNRVIERHAPLVESGAGLETSPFAAGHGGGADRPNRLPPLSSAMFAWSDRVEQKDVDTVAKTLATATGGHLTSAATWVDWVGAITDSGPDLLLLLSHSERDAADRRGDARDRGRRRRRDERVRSAVRPARAAAEEQAEARPGTHGVPAGLRHRDAVDRVPDVRRRLPLLRRGDRRGDHRDRRGQPRGQRGAAALVKQLAAQKTAAAFGDVLLTARRNLLAGGEVMALTLTSYGDSDASLA